MKRIVKEINPDKLFLLNKNNNKVEEWAIKIPMQQVAFPQGGPEYVELEQVTYDQAFDEFPAKPVAKLTSEGVEYLGELSTPPGKFQEYIKILIGSDNECSTEIFDCFHCWALDDELYQAASWRDLHMNVIPALMRMAETKHV